jgi:hypothetical protein
MSLSWASGFDGHAQELRECSATLERAFADVERADLGPGLFDDLAFLIDLLVAQSPLVSFSQFEPNFDYRHVPIVRRGIADRFGASSIHGKRPVQSKPRRV